MPSCKATLYSLISILILLSLTACKIDMKQEIWLKKDNSGKASVIVHMQIPFGLQNETLDLQELNSFNALSSLAEVARKTPGVSVTRLAQEETHNKKEMNLSYYLDFTFKDVEGLSTVLSAEGRNAIFLTKSGKHKVLCIKAEELALIEDDDSDEFDFLSFIEINLRNKVNLPARVKKIDNTGYGKYKGKTATWDIALDDDWLSCTSHLLYVHF